MLSSTIRIGVPLQEHAFKELVCGDLPTTLLEKLGLFLCSTIGIER